MAHGGARGQMAAFPENAENLGKTKGIPGFEEFQLFKEWCTRMESNHHAIAGTRT
jgi:heme-degrading monooxygenase HmoA